MPGGEDRVSGLQCTGCIVFLRERGKTLQCTGCIVCFVSRRFLHSMVLSRLSCAMWRFGLQCVASWLFKELYIQAQVQQGTGAPTRAKQDDTAGWSHSHTRTTLMRRQEHSHTSPSPPRRRRQPPCPQPLRPAGRSAGQGVHIVPLRLQLRHRRRHLGRRRLGCRLGRRALAAEPLGLQRLCVHPLRAPAACLASPRLAAWPRCPLLRRAKHVSRRTVGRAATSRQGPMSSVAKNRAASSCRDRTRAPSSAGGLMLLMLLCVCGCVWLPHMSHLALRRHRQRR
jgi:hypothetical protein